MLDRSTKRRTFIASTISVLTAGCVGSSVRPSDTTTTTSTTTERDCGRLEDPTDESIRAYRSLTGEFSNISDTVGIPEQFRTDSVFGNSGFFHLNCSSSQDSCESEYLSAIERFQTAQTTVEELQEGFKSLKTYVEECNVDEPQLFKDESDNGIEKANAFTPPLEKFITSAKRHVDEDLDQFDPGETFQKGMREYNSALRTNMMGSETLRQKGEVYNGD